MTSDLQSQLASRDTEISSLQSELSALSVGLIIATSMSIATHTCVPVHVYMYVCTMYVVHTCIYRYMYMYNIHVCVYVL